MAPHSTISTATTTNTGKETQTVLQRKVGGNISETMQKFVEAKTERKKLLQAGYTTSKRRQEIISILVFSGLLVYCSLWLFQHYGALWHGALEAFEEQRKMADVSELALWGNWAKTVLVIPAVSIVLGILAADFVSGLVHWLADTWGTIDYPLVGQTFIRSFREHHIDPVKMTKHDWIQSNGDNCLASSILIFIPLTYLHLKNALDWPPLVFSDGETDDVFIMFFSVLFNIFIALTNQFHKWSHTYHLPAWVKFLQNNHLILNRASHNLHHKMPFECGYCITTGWLNPPLDAIGFWRAAETVMSAVTGLKPRDDDMKWNDHRKFLDGDGDSNDLEISETTPNPNRKAN